MKILLDFRDANAEQKFKEYCKSRTEVKILHASPRELMNLLDTDIEEISGVDWFSQTTEEGLYVWGDMIEGDSYLGDVEKDWLKL